MRGCKVSTGFQVVPPSVLMSTFAMSSSPDQAAPPGCSRWWV